MPLFFEGRGGGGGVVVVGGGGGLELYKKYIRFSASGGAAVTT